MVDFETIWPLEGKVRSSFQGRDNAVDFQNGEQSRETIIKKLFKRSQSTVSETEIARLLDSGELVQFCVELTAVADTSVSQDFSRDVLGYRTSPHRHDQLVEKE